MTRITQFILIGAIAAAAVPIIFFAVLSMVSSRPTTLGLVNGRLADCPATPNCVSSQASDPSKRMEPIHYSGSADDAMKQLAAVVTTLPRATIVTRSQHYLHVEYTTLIFRYVDDVEFQIDPNASVIHFRSASRVGHSDLGVNRKRMDMIQKAFEASR
ncbi:MAG: DUF1499 domain-containing protein [Planctomycetota bacterium]